jgi:hypothetical protein
MKHDKNVHSTDSLARNEVSVIAPGGPSLGSVMKLRTDNSPEKGAKALPNVLPMPPKNADAGKRESQG